MRKLKTKILKKSLKVVYKIDDLVKEKIDEYDLETLKEFKREYEKDLTKEEKQDDEILLYVKEKIEDYYKRQKQIKALYGK